MRGTGSTQIQRGGGAAGCRGWGGGTGGQGLMRRGSVWEDDKVGAMDGGGRYRIVNVLTATEFTLQHINGISCMSTAPQ